MKEVKEYVLNFMPTKGELAEALLIDKRKKCIVNLRWFNPFKIKGVPMGENKLSIDENMTYAKCLEQLGFIPASNR